MKFIVEKLCKVLGVSLQNFLKINRQTAQKFFGTNAILGGGGRQAPGFSEKHLSPFSEYKTIFCYEESDVGSSEYWYLSICKFGTCLLNYVGTFYQTVISTTLKLQFWYLSFKS
jgi:hypothetical protein